ncbi:MAG: guanylate kinase [Myxococcota bacterium]
MLKGWRRPSRGVLFVVTGPSGVGKSTLIREARALIPDLDFGVSATTREARAGEVHGVDYLFMTPEEFDKKVEEGAFLEHARVYDHAYGTPRAAVEEALAAGRSILLDIDVAGHRQVLASGLQGVHVLLLPPDLATLERRLRSRGTDSDEIIARRMLQVAGQLEAVREFDHLVVNDHLQSAHRVFQGVLLAALTRTSHRYALVQQVTEWFAEQDGS